MKKIVIVTNRNAADIGLLGLLAVIFPECEVEIFPSAAGKKSRERVVIKPTAWELRSDGPDR